VERNGTNNEMIANGGCDARQRRPLRFFNDLRETMNGQNPLDLGRAGEGEPRLHLASTPESRAMSIRRWRR
jgi:hypothetical protein